MENKSKLPGEEWKFDAVPDSEIAACFWWEYVRSELDEELRRVIAAPGFSTFEIPRWEHVASELDGELTPKRTDGGSAMGHNYETFRRALRPRPGESSFAFGALLLIFLQERVQTLFAKQVPWVRLPIEVRKQLTQSIPRVRIPAHVRQLSTVILQNKDQIACAESVEQVRRLFESPNHRYKAFYVAVDLSCSNAQITEAFSAQLAKMRPKQWKEPKRDARTSLYEFPASSHRAALRWLGILRCKGTVSKWSDLKSVYNIRDDPRELQKLGQRAKLVIQWMRDGKKGCLEKLPAGKAKTRRVKD